MVQVGGYLSGLGSLGLSAGTVFPRIGQRLPEELLAMDVPATLVGDSSLCLLQARNLR